MDATERAICTALTAGGLAVESVVVARAVDVPSCWLVSAVVLGQDNPGILWPNRPDAEDVEGIALELTAERMLVGSRG